ncbi:mechanosensitive ion channel [Halorussus sp. MSC15.2]|nr:mechanosensitive ion channel domain-containing protein [Halorussus sp. MSC15.2]NEU58440.1 mechanosensitive ion channel [Halorussus sp. MSC15.2]
MTGLGLQAVPDVPETGYLGVTWSVLEFLITFAVAYAVGRWVFEPGLDRALDGWRVPKTAANAFLKVLHVAVVVVALRLALDVADYGYLLSVPPTVVAALTVAIGFASRDIAANLVGGVFIVTDPEFNIGDWIRWQDREGVIEDISFRVTRVRTFDNELLTVPNSELATSAVVNAVAKSPRRISHTFHVATTRTSGKWRPSSSPKRGRTPTCSTGRRRPSAWSNSTTVGRACRRATGYPNRRARRS